MKFWAVGSVCILLVSLYQVGSAEQCGRQAGGALCPDGYCCSAFGWCGTGDAYCKDGCQSGCCDDEGGGGGGGGEEGGGGDESGRSITEVISEDDFEQMLMHRNEVSYGCERNGFYTYDAFVTAAKDFPKFGNNGNDTTRKTEIAAFFGQTSHETTGGWEGAPDGPLTWGYCFVTERNKQDYCTPNPTYPCAPGKQYYGRGPIQLTHNVNYGQAGEALGLDLLNDPDLVATDPVVTFKAAIWFWMTAQPPKPSCHDVIIGNWQPSDTDKNAGRLPGYGLTTNIINGGIECGQGVSNDQVENRIDFYKRYCEMFGVSYGDNLDCYHMTPYGNILSALSLSKVA